MYVNDICAFFLWRTVIQNKVAMCSYIWVALILSYFPCCYSSVVYMYYVYNLIDSTTIISLPVGFRVHLYVLRATYA